MRMLTETEMGVVAGGGPQPPPWEDPCRDSESGMPLPSPYSRPWETFQFGENGDDGGNDNGSGETPAEARRAKTEEIDRCLRQNAQTAKETCGLGNVRKVGQEDFECHAPCND